MQKSNEGSPGGGSAPRRGWRLLVPLVTATAGMLFATSAATARGTDLRPDRGDDVGDLIRRENSRVTAYRQSVERLRAEVLTATEQEARRNARVARARARLDALESAAGLTAVTGPAVTVALDDAPRSRDGSVPEGAQPDDLVVHQQDVQAVVNALWAGGARAVRLMDQRVIATSAVRCVGNTLILHGIVYSPPFRVTAVGDPPRLRAALAASPGVRLYREYVDTYGLGYQVTVRDRETLPPFRGTLDLLFARATP